MAKYQYRGAEQPELIGKVYECYQLPPQLGRQDQGFLAWAQQVSLDDASAPELGDAKGLLVHTLSGPSKARPWDWITKSAKGSFCVVSSTNFEENFAPYQEGA